MKVHRLTMTAFGPFAQTQTIDFDTLAAGGLFLIHGPTGSGKTSVLDALCFALFADVPGARSARGLRSDLAAAGETTSVHLEFTASGRRLRVRRTPEQSRPKLRGTGLVKAPASVTLEERRHGVWTVCSARIDETAEVIADVVGMGLAQFQRIALLPQGQFADFLRADARERHRLLTALFDVGALEDVESWLAEQRRSSGERLARSEHELGYLWRTLTDLLAGLGAGGETTTEDGPAPPFAPAEWLPDTALEERDWRGEVERIRAGLTGQALLAATAYDQALETHRTAREELVEVTARHTAWGRGARAQAEQAALAAAGADIAVLRDRRTDALRAAGIRPELIALTKAEQAADAAETEVTAAENALRAAGLLVDESADDERELATALAEQSESLAGLAVAEQTLRAAPDRLRRAAAGREVAVAARARHTQEGERRAARQAELAAQVLAAEAAAARIGPVSAALDRFTDAQELLTRLAGLDAALAEKQAGELVAQRAELEAGRALLDLESARVADLAAEFAGSLEPGCACPVCGATEHPAPAKGGAQWSPAAITSARTDVERRTRERAALREDITRIGERAAGTREQLAGLGVLGAQVSDGDAAAANVVVAREIAELTIELSALRDLHAALPAAQQQERAVREQVAQEAERALSLGVEAELAAVAVRSALTETRAAGAEARAAVDAHDATCPCARRPSRALPAGPAQGADRTAPPSSVLDGEVTAAEVEEAREAARVGARDLAAARQRHTDTVAKVAAAGRLRDRLREAEAELLVARAECAAAVAGSGFADRDVAQAAWQPEAMVATFTEQIEDHERRLAGAGAVLAEEDVIAALAMPEPDVAEAAQQTEIARLQEQRAARATTTLERAGANVGSTLEAILRVGEQVAKHRSEHRRLSALADLVAGTSAENTLRMRLSTFVLAARLERVVDLANERLARMGDGRFQLAHDDSLAGRGARSGLGLHVRDEWSGATRSPASLSGGESFMASLALALGLADALRESVGGVELQTLFIDEGFGSLDEISLDDVLGVLDDLRDGGRAVGVVSHLRELHDRIPSQLAVTKANAGSSVQIRTGSSAA